MQFADRDVMSAVLHGKKPPLSHYNDFKAVSYMLCRLFSFSAPVQVPPSLRVQRAGLSASLYQSQVVRESRRLSEDAEELSSFYFKQAAELATLPAWAAFSPVSGPEAGRHRTRQVRMTVRRAAICQDPIRPSRAQTEKNVRSDGPLS